MAVKPIRKGDSIKFWQPPTKKRDGGWSYGTFVSVYRGLASVRRYGQNRVTKVPMEDVKPREPDRLPRA